ncbi:MAG: hypothetical protein LBU50_03975 [Cellulomonas sp.]|jgi:hypothetical protein|nr:hypothetical protein [Cellulomonas sp.]
MSEIVVTTQDELDTALAAADDTTVIIDSPVGTSIEVGDSSHVVARGSSHVVAWGSSHVDAGRYVSVHLHSQLVELSGGVVIDMTQVDLDDTDTWVELTGASADGDDLLLYKATGPDLTTGAGYIATTWAVGETVVASDWAPDRRCGWGLHVSAHPCQAVAYRPDAEASRMLLVRVARAEVITLGTDKVKVPCCTVVREVALDGSELEVVAP